MKEILIPIIFLILFIWSGLTFDKIKENKLVNKLTFLIFVWLCFGIYIGIIIHIDWLIY